MENTPQEKQNYEELGIKLMLRNRPVSYSAGNKEDETIYGLGMKDAEEI